MGCGASTNNQQSSDKPAAQAANGQKYESGTKPAAADDDEGNLDNVTETAAAPRKNSLITVKSTRGYTASGYSTPKLVARATEARVPNEGPKEKIAPPPTNPDGSASPSSGSNDEMFVFGDFSVDPGDVKRQRIERLNRIAKPGSSLRRRTAPEPSAHAQAAAAVAFGDYSGANDSSSSSAAASSSSAAARGGAEPQKDEDVFVLNDFVVKILEQDDEGEGVGYTFMHEVPIPKGFKQLQSYHQTSLIGLPLRVKSLALMADEKTFLMASIEDTAPLLMNTNTGQEVSCFLGHTNAIVGVVTSKCGKFIATSSRDGTVGIWDAPGVKDNAVRKQSKILSEPAATNNSIPLCASFSNDSTSIVVGYQDRMCRVWELNSRDGSIVTTFEEHKGVIIAASCHPKEPWCATGAGDRTVIMWKIYEGTMIRRFPGHEGPVLATAFSVEGDKLLSCDGRLCKIWKVEDGSSLFHIKIAELFPNLAPPVAATPTLTGTSSLRRTGTLSKKGLGDSSSGGGSFSSGAGDKNERKVYTVATALTGPHTMATIKKSLESTGAMQNTSFTAACFAPGMLASSYFLLSTTMNTVVVVSLATGREEMRMPTKGPVFALCNGRSETVLFGDMFGNVYRVNMR